MDMIDHLHDFMCKGNKDYRGALRNVNDYNAAKILTHKISIPSPDGQYKYSELNLGVFWGVQMDIERFNYVDIVLRKYKMGILQQEIQKAEATKTVIKRSKFE